MRFATLVAGIAAVLSLSASSAEAGQARRGPAYGKKGHSHKKSSAVVVVNPARPATGATVVYGHSHYHGCGHYGYYGYRSYGYRPYYRSYYYTQPAPVYTQPAPVYTQPAPAPAPQRQSYDRVNEIGLRGIAGGTNGSFESVAGVGAYVRARNGNLGLEGSIDSTAVASQDGSQVFGRVPVMGAFMLYLNPQSPIRLYGLLGGGVSFEQAGNVATGALTTQAGAGIDLDLSYRASLNLDVRGIQDLADPNAEIQGLPTPDSFVTGNIGISLKF